MKLRKSLILISVAGCLAGCGISQQQEVQMGQEYAQQINAQLPIIQDPELNRYINVIGDSIARLTSRGDLDWHFFIVDAQEVNAFAVPGGFVYVNRGLIQRADQMDELAGVLGHEIGHVVRRHTVKQMEKEQGANVGITLACILTGVCNSQVAGAAINIAGGALFARFSRQDEAEADVEGVKNTVRAGVSPAGMVTMIATSPFPAHRCASAMRLPSGYCGPRRASVTGIVAMCLLTRGATRATARCTIESIAGSGRSVSTASSRTSCLTGMLIVVSSAISSTSMARPTFRACTIGIPLTTVFMSECECPLTIASTFVFRFRAKFMSRSKPTSVGVQIRFTQIEPRSSRYW